MEKYDLIVIGAGPAGYAAAMRGIDFGKKVCLIEVNKVGGTGVYNGALSSKTLWELSSRVKKVNETLHLNSNEKPFEFTWNEISKAINEAVFERKFQYSCHIKLLQTESMHKLLHFERGYGSFVDSNRILIKQDKNEKIIWGENIIIATGSRPRIDKKIKVDHQTILTSDSIELIDDYPKSIVIIGAGVIGCEYATMFSNFGKTKVYLIDRQERILPFEDEDISEIISNNLENKNVTIHHNAQLISLEKVDNEVEYTLAHPDGKTETIRVEKALLS
ncbi:MAG: FAD-dependent oxidoreductase, partial [Crocinitomicaceae bacterium]